jgi:secreted PhoX family phosphatase
MSDVSRRTFLAGAGATAAAVTAGVVLPEAALAAGREATQGEASTSTLVVHVTDAKSGRLTVLSGDREVTVIDRRLAQRLARLAD